MKKNRLKKYFLKHYLLVFLFLISISTFLLFLLKIEIKGKFLLENKKISGYDFLVVIFSDGGINYLFKFLFNSIDFNSLSSKSGGFLDFLKKLNEIGKSLGFESYFDTVFSLFGSEIKSDLWPLRIICWIWILSCMGIFSILLFSKTKRT